MLGKNRANKLTHHHWKSSWALFKNAKRTTETHRHRYNPFFVAFSSLMTCHAACYPTTTPYTNRFHRILASTADRTTRTHLFTLPLYFSLSSPKRKKIICKKITWLNQTTSSFSFFLKWIMHRYTNILTQTSAYWKVNYTVRLSHLSSSSFALQNKVKQALHIF